MTNGYRMLFLAWNLFKYAVGVTAYIGYGVAIYYWYNNKLTFIQLFLALAAVWVLTWVAFLLFRYLENIFFVSIMNKRDE
ncbi:hypothetical protein JI58_03980 [Marinosulfonomonas sp. PRT-SC04]|nr:hypothetical protein JI58_03980 [Marinosulfonomonas sp. PRT-SC04]